MLDTSLGVHAGLAGSRSKAAGPAGPLRNLGGGLGVFPPEPPGAGGGGSPEPGKESQVREAHQQRRICSGAACTLSGAEALWSHHAPSAQQTGCRGTWPGLFRAPEVKAGTAGIHSLVRGCPLWVSPGLRKQASPCPRLGPWTQMGPLGV